MNKKNIISIILIGFCLMVSLSSISATNDTVDNTKLSEIETNDNSDTYISQDLEKNLKSDGNIIHINSNNFEEYVTNGTFNEKVSDGDTVDFQGKFDSSRFNLTVNKTLNIIGSDDNYINLYGTGIFKINSGASGSNITGLNFEHTRIMIENVTNLNFNNCSVIAEHNVGFGVGMFSVRDGSDNITITNSYFKTTTNGGHSNVVFAGATNVLFENNTIVGSGAVGNLLYLTTYNSPAENLTYGNQNITIRNNYIDGKEVLVAEICYAIALEGNNIILENNTVEYYGKCIVPQWGQGKQNNIKIINNTIPYGTCYLSFSNQTANNNIFNSVQSNNNALYNNTIKNISTLGNLTLEGNTIETITINGDNIIINNNTVRTNNSYAINTNNKTNITITNNKIASLKGRGDEAINGLTELLENNTITNTTIYINNENLEEYFTIEDSLIYVYYTVKDNKIFENDTVILQLNTTQIGKIFTIRFNNSINLKLILNGTLKLKGTIELVNDSKLYLHDSYINSTLNADLILSASIIEIINSTLNITKSLTLTSDNSTIINSKIISIPGGISRKLSINGQLINSSLPGVCISNGNVTVINSTACMLGSKINTESSNNLGLNSLNNQENNRILTYLYTFYKKIVNEDTGLLQDSIVEGDTIHVLEYENENVNIIIDRPINLSGIPYEGVIKANITFIEGSEGTNITNVTFDGTVNINTTDINFIEGNIFNGPVNNPYVPATNVPVMININCSNVIVNNVDTSLSVNVTTTDGVLITEGYIEIYNDGILVEKTNLTEGNVNVTIKIENVVKNNPIRVWYYPEDDTYQKNNTIFDIESIKSNVTLTIENNTARVNENETIIALVTADNNQTVNGGNVTFIIRSWKFDVPVEDGMAKLNLIVNESWYERPTLRLIYSGSDLFNYNSTTNIAMNILEAYPITLKVDTTEFTTGSTTNIQASIYKGDNINTNINKGKVTFKVNGKTVKDANGKVIYAKVVNGTATIENYEVPSDWAKEGTTIQAVYSGSTQCDKLTSEKTNITVAKSVPTLTTEDINTTTGSTITLKATVTDNDKVINTGKIIFKINGKTVKDDNGKIIYAKVVNNTVTVEYTLPDTYKAKDYTITATFISSDYDRLTDEKTLKITA